MHKAVNRALNCLTEILNPPRSTENCSSILHTYLLYGIVDRLQRLKSLGVKQIGESYLYWRHLTSVLQQPLFVGVRSKVPAWCSVSHTSAVL